MTLYSESFPKRPDITGSFEQAYSLTYMFEAVVKAIGANLIAGVMGCQHTGEIFYLFCLKVHHDTAGNPVAIIGNLSNTIGQFLCARITKADFSLFTVVGEKSDAPPTHGDTIDPAIMEKTSFDANTDYVAYLMPSYALIYTGGWKSFMETSLMMILNRQSALWAQVTYHGQKLLPPPLRTKTTLTQP